MKCLAVFPTMMHNYSFSAPCVWLFSNYTDRLKGVYGFELDLPLVEEYDYFIIELNWYIQLVEFLKIVSFIKKIKPNSVILFGGLFASLHYEKLFSVCGVDLYIKGDNELPMRMFMEGTPPEQIPNMVGRNFTNPVDYCFQYDEFFQMDFSLDWFPSHFQYSDITQYYPLPMLLTSKGGCSTVHRGCDYCMGSKFERLKDIYRRDPVVMDNNALQFLLQKINGKFERATIFIMSEYTYDFRNRFYDLDVNIEVDGPFPLEKIEEIFAAFRRCTLNLAIYKEGLTGQVVIDNFKSLLELEDDDHKIMFFSFFKDALVHKIPLDHLIFSDAVVPWWAHWDYYSNYDIALDYSNKYYQVTDVFDLYYSNNPPKPRFFSLE